MAAKFCYKAKVVVSASIIASLIQSLHRRSRPVSLAEYIPVAAISTPPTLLVVADGDRRGGFGSRIGAIGARW
ncbi:unnamed protein product [Linum trigynum]|uniref:Secreted protein n=1 Tax=Linum trigynum TaxID=586398 RepID=A0AAV2CF76_9ROSI